MKQEGQMAFWNRPHVHYWVCTNSNAVAEKGQQAIAEIRTYQCFRCGSIRYDKVDGTGLVSSKVTDDKGAIVTNKMPDAHA